MYQAQGDYHHRQMPDMHLLKPLYCSLCLLILNQRHGLETVRGLIWTKAARPHQNEAAAFDNATALHNAIYAQGREKSGGSNPDSLLEAARPVLPAADMPPHWLWAAMCHNRT